MGLLALAVRPAINQCFTTMFSLESQMAISLGCDGEMPADVNFCLCV